MRPNELQHYGVRGMRWGYRKSEGARASQARTKAELAKIDVQDHDRKTRLADARSKLQKDDKVGKRRLRLEERASKLDIKARRAEVIAKYRREPGKDRPQNRDQRNDRPQDRDQQNDRSRDTYRPEKAKYYDGIFKKALAEAAIKGAGTAAQNLVFPSSKTAGEGLRDYLVSRNTKRRVANNVVNFVKSNPEFVRWSEDDSLRPNADDWLMHYGIKGMKWRKHKEPTRSDPEFTIDKEGDISEWGDDHTALSGKGVPVSITSKMDWTRYGVSHGKLVQYGPIRVAFNRFAKKANRTGRDRINAFNAMVSGLKNRK